jgi:hypothetical protein
MRESKIRHRLDGNESDWRNSLPQTHPTNQFAPNAFRTRRPVTTHRTPRLHNLPISNQLQTETKKDIENLKQ